MTRTTRHMTDRDTVEKLISQTVQNIIFAVCDKCVQNITGNQALLQQGDICYDKVCLKTKFQARKSQKETT